MAATEEEILARKLRQAGSKPSEATDLAPDEEPDIEEPESTPDEAEVLRQQLETLQQQMSAIQGRLAPTQRDNEVLRSQAEDLRRLAEKNHNEREALQRELDRINSAQSQQYFESLIEQTLTDEERELIDPTVLKALKRSIGTVASKLAQPPTDIRAEAERIFSEKEAAKVAKYREGLLNDPSKGFTKLRELANDSRFREYCNEHPEVDYYLNKLVQADSIDEVNRFSRLAKQRLDAFAGSVANSDKATPAETPTPSTLERAMRRNKTQGQQLTEQQRAQKLADVRALSRSRNAADRLKAQQILNTL